jgi:hypothetical protein
MKPCFSRASTIAHFAIQSSELQHQGFKLLVVDGFVERVPPATESFDLPLEVITCGTLLRRKPALKSVFDEDFL